MFGAFYDFKLLGGIQLRPYVINEKVCDCLLAELDHLG